MPKIADVLTPTAIKNALPRSTPFTIFDGKETGLHVLVQSSGTKTFRLKTSIDGKDKRITLGQFPGMTLVEARAEAARLKTEIKKGIDPTSPIVEVKKITFGEVTQNYLDAARKRKSEQRIFKIKQALNKHVLPDWKDIEIGKIKAGEVIRLLQQAERHGTYIVTCVHRYIGWVFDFAVSTGEIELIPVTNATLNHIAPHRTTSVRAMEFNRLPHFIADLDEYRGHQITKLAMKLILLTAVRTIELRRLQWDWINLDKSLIRIPADQHKTGIRKENGGEGGEEFYVLLSRQALRILDKARIITGESELVFPSPYDHSKMASDAIINKSLDRMGWKDEHDGHGFRALFRSQMEKEGHDTKILELCLGHSLGRSKTENAYARGMNMAFFQERAKVMQDWANLIDSQRDTE
jgi:integrase